MVDVSYTYKALQPGVIRLLQLQSSSYRSDLSMCIEHTTLEEAPAYEALSYTWGSAAANCTVRCETGIGTQKIAVTKNLDEALLRLRDSSHARMLWIDQICINQDDLAERNAQVSRMGDIYASASRVVIWIGEEDEDTDMAFRFLPVLLAYLPLSLQNSSGKQDEEDQYLLPAEALMIARSAGWEALSRLFNRPWFQRVWVIQETTMAASARVYCGSYSSSWCDLAKACRCQARDQSTTEGQKGAESIDRLRHNYHSDVGITLDEALFMSYRFQCTDFRDKIFALAGLVRRADRGALPPLQYELSVEEIYHRSTVAIMRNHGNLDLLRCVVHPRAPSKLPSWVPDWRAKPKVQRMLRNVASDSHKTHPDLGINFSFSDEDSMLTVQGRSLGEISMASTEMTYLEQDDILPKWRDLAKSASKPGSAKHPRNFWETLIAASEPGYPKDMAAENDESTEAKYYAWQTVIDRRSHVGSNLSSSSLSVDNEKSLDFNGRMLETCIGRRLLVIGAAGIGLGPSESRPGDLVCCIGQDIERLSALYVIRHEGVSFKLIGEAYVHSVSGRFANLLQFCDLPHQQFILS